MIKIKTKRIFNQVPKSSRITIPSEKTSLGQDCKEILAHRQIIKNFVGRDLKIKYQRSILGFFWTLLNPLLMVVIYTLVFSKILQFNIPFYPIFILSGLLPWNFFSQSLSMGSRSITDNSGLINQVSFPLEILTLSTILSILVDFIVELGLLMGILFIMDWNLSPAMLFLPILIVIEFILILGISLILATLNVFFRDVQHIISILLTAWFFLTPIFYTFESVPPPYRPLYKLNPMAGIIAAFRDILYYDRFPALDFLIYPGIVSLVTFLAGYLIFKGFKGVFPEEA
ncbi:MAG TPA: ABC transporter permease [Candidatus Limnocylindrales bacterium]|nr:ABC transporter permease [Candidatus Limnocylindrales bacterium]